jgi:hypothetical protein
MKLITKKAITAVLSSVALSASAMTPIQDADLSQVTGQDGVSIAADLHINIGSFVYTDTDATGGSVSFNNIKINGTVAATLDIINNATFKASTFAASGAGSLGIVNPSTMPITTPAEIAAATAQGAAVAAFAPAGDVVKIAVPNIAVNAAHGLNVSVDSIKMGNSAASYGSFANNDIKLQGTTVYIWAH